MAKSPTNQEAIVELLLTECLGRPLRLEGSMAGWQQLYWDNQLVAQQAASSLQSVTHSHNFQLKNAEKTLECKLDIDLQWQPFSLSYSLFINGQLVTEGQRNTQDIERQTPVEKPKLKQKISLIGLGSLALKLFKSAKAIKVLFAGASLAAYSWLFSFEFALALIGCLVFHEYGHIRAMKYFKMPTKGIYLIPFVGGLAMSDSKINTRWQDVVISIMGPTFGMFLSIAALLAYWITDLPFFAALASLNALLNLFNLLPILPLDGGHILKSISFSFNSITGITLCAVAAAVGIYFCYIYHLGLLAIMLLIGSVEILVEWRNRHISHLLPLDRYGQIVSSLWYLITSSVLIAIIFAVAESNDPILSMPLKILAS
jgi:Zn-dependent protease